MKTDHMKKLQQALVQAMSKEERVEIIAYLQPGLGRTGCNKLHDIIAATMPVEERNRIMNEIGL